MNKYLVTLLVLGAVSCAHAAGFDCTKASSLVENEICTNPLLSKLDEALNIDHDVLKNSFYTFSADVAKEKLIKLDRDETAWLKERNRCTSSACLEGSYRKRIYQLCDAMKPYQTAEIVKACRSDGGMGGTTLSGLNQPD